MRRDEGKRRKHSKMLPVHTYRRECGTGPRNEEWVWKLNYWVTIGHWRGNLVQRPRWSELGSWALPAPRDH